MSENLLNQNVKIKCKKCGNFIDIKKNEYLYRKQYIDASGNVYYVVYIDCSMCGRRHYMQIDDKETNEIKNKCIKVMTAILKKSVNGFSIPPSQQKKYKNLNSKLKQKRYELMKGILNKELIDEDGNKIVIEEFTLC